jgi:hypothetical protein
VEQGKPSLGKVVAVSVEGPGGEKIQCGGRDVRMLHEESPHEIVFVAQSVRGMLIGVQEKAGVLDPPAGQDVSVGRNLK